MPLLVAIAVGIQVSLEKYLTFDLPNLPKALLITGTRGLTSDILSISCLIYSKFLLLQY